MVSADIIFNIDKKIHITNKLVHRMMFRTYCQTLYFVLSPNSMKFSRSDTRTGGFYFDPFLLEKVSKYEMPEVSSAGGERDKCHWKI